MRKTVLVCLLGFVIGAVVGAGGMLLLYPYLFPPPVLNEQIRDAPSKSVSASGSFIHPNPDDPIHWGKGGVSIYRGEQAEIFLEPDFEVGPGPAYYLYLADAPGIMDNGAFESSGHLEIGKLKSFSGSQVYAIPENTTVDNYQSVVVWCKAFGQLITSADLLRQ